MKPATARTPHLGASLYVPATRPKLAAVLSGRELPTLRSVIACTEDAVADGELEGALANLATVLRALDPIEMRSDLLRFVRVRNPAVMARVLDMPGVEKIDGFVLPKFTLAVLPQYQALLKARNFWLMPTLETSEVFEQDAMRELSLALCRKEWKPRILALRVGGSDLLRLLGLRRTRGFTLYDTPLGSLLSQLILTFKPLGFALTAPVFDFIEDEHVLAQEAKRDVAFGFCGKTAIHPAQIATIEAAFHVSASELIAARRLMEPDCPAVFKHDGTMYEAVVHRDWARQVIAKREMLAL
ncbi:HpcH/HpaI aldolase/citrate lyase family protein [Variovorax rhizosphaerae]|uniref:HpcH/HpaI aldolase/citrate lyase family protein n=1 Tax=Variovorax rhizosphaerae TaxID=1836200 RepID=A0ABU8WM04_9BURK